MEASATTVRGGRSVLERSPLARLPDQVLQWGLTTLAALILVLLAYFFVRLIGQSGNVFGKYGLGFVFGNDWDVSRNIYHGAALVAGTLITSAIALVIGVPVAVGTALFTNEVCPRRFRGPLAVLVDLLAAVPSVVYGLWACSCWPRSCCRSRSGSRRRSRSFRGWVAARRRSITTSSPG